MLEDEREYRKFLLDFYSAELNAHARLLVGFAVILLTLIQVRQGLEIVVSWQLSAFYLALWGVGFAFWYLIMRHLMYGQFASAAMGAPLDKEGKSLQAKVFRGMEKYIAKQRVFFVFKTSLFTYGSQGWKERVKYLTGVVSICGILSIGTTIFAFMLIDFLL